MTKPRILIGIETLVSGGAESFVVRLANSLADRYEVSLFVVFGDRVDSRLLSRQENHFKLIGFKLRADFFVMKFDALLLRLKVDFSLRNAFVIRRLRRIITEGKYEILHSNQFKVDLVFYVANLHFKVRHITTIHGDYIAFGRQSKLGKLRFLNFEHKAKEVLRGVSGIVYISDHQLSYLKSELNVQDLESRSAKIYNGIRLPSETASHLKAKETTGRFVFGMVARGIPEKGWEAAILSFIQLNCPDCDLILVGESDYLRELEEKYKQHRIIFAGYTSEPLGCIGRFDVGLLPTTFASESLPTSIIEYLAMGKPVIATDVGEIRSMLNQNGRVSGFVIPVERGAVDLTLFSRAMEQLKLDKKEYANFSANAYSNAKAFDIALCSSSYSDFYRTRWSHAS